MLKVHLHSSCLHLFQAVQVNPCCAARVKIEADKGTGVKVMGPVLSVVTAVLTTTQPVYKVCDCEHKKLER